LATLAYSDLPNGTRIVFVPRESGVAANVIHGSDRATKQQLTVTQFEAWLNDYWSSFGGSATPKERARSANNSPVDASASPSNRNDSSNVPVSQVAKYRPRLTQRQIDQPSNWAEQYELALSAFDADLVNVARARNGGATETLDWLVRAQQRRDANNINRTKPLIFPVR
jgi:hypothetical protein